MKKSVVAMLTSALVVGATATTFAAANPFSDVPAGHWAYNAVTRLASEGIIEGYGDGTYRGNRQITRYEMAQMVARALAKTPTANISSSSRGDLDKLAAEFRDELDSLGVRVAELEKHSDMVQWSGKIEYTYGHLREKNAASKEETAMGHSGVFRLEPKAEVNSHWTANARMDLGYNGRADSTTDAKLKRIYAQGDYNKFSVKLGRFGFCPDVEDGLVADTVISGGGLSFGSKWKFNVTAGRVGANSDEAHYYTGGGTSAVTSYLDSVGAVVNQAIDRTTYDPISGQISGFNPNIKSDGRVYDANGNLTYTPVRDAATYAAIGRAWAEYDNGTFSLPYSSASSLRTSLETTYKNEFFSELSSLEGYTIEEGDDLSGVSDANIEAAKAAALDETRSYAKDIVDGEVSAAKRYASVVQNTHPTDIVALNVQYDQGETGIFGGASWYHAKDDDFKNYFYSDDADTNKANIWAVNLGYRLSEDFRIWGAYASNTKADREENGWEAQLRYGRYGDYSEAGDWAIWGGYARYGYNVALATDQGDDVQTGTKGWHVGAAYAPFKNVGLLARYSDGKWITSGDKYRKIFGRVEFFF